MTVNDERIQEILRDLPEIPAPKDEIASALIYIAELMADGTSGEGITAGLFAIADSIKGLARGISERKTP